MQNPYFSQIMGITLNLAPLVVPVLLVLYSGEIVSVFNTTLDYVGINPQAHAARIEATAVLADQAHQVSVARETSVVEIIQIESLEAIETHALAAKNAQIEDRDATIWDLQKSTERTKADLSESRKRNWNLTNITHSLIGRIIGRDALAKATDAEKIEAASFLVEVNSSLIASNSSLIASNSSLAGAKSSLAGATAEICKMQQDLNLSQEKLVATRSVMDLFIDAGQKHKDTELILQIVIRKMTSRTARQIAEIKTALDQSSRELFDFKEFTTDQLVKFEVDAARATKDALNLKTVEIRQFKEVAKLEQNLIQDKFNKQALIIKERVEEKREMIADFRSETAEVKRRLQCKHEAELGRKDTILATYVKERVQLFHELRDQDVKLIAVKKELANLLLMFLSE